MLTMYIYINIYRDTCIYIYTARAQMTSILEGQTLQNKTRPKFRSKQAKGHLGSAPQVGIHFWVVAVVALLI